MRDGQGRKLTDFAGKWRLHRRIIHQDQTPAHFTGTAQWRPAPGGMVYHEHGTLNIACHPPARAERRYFWHPHLQVDFNDGQFFHHVPAQGGEARHSCDPDMYVVRYDFSNWPHFNVIWQVTGPAKAYTMISRYSRGCSAATDQDH